jgi:putative intracellular protease/amidase
MELVIKETLEQSGIQVVISSLSGETISVDSVIIKPDLTLDNVGITDYDGFIFPCMAPPREKICNLNPKVVSFVKEAATKDKPMAAQTLSVADFAQAGLLLDRRYAFTLEPDIEE